MTDEDYMRMAIEEARRAEELDEVPIGAVVVYEPSILERAACREPQVESRARATCARLRRIRRGMPSSSHSSRRPSVWACGG